MIDSKGSIFLCRKKLNQRKKPTNDSSGWQKNNFRWNDTEFMNHVTNGGNYGIIGGFGNLILIDADSLEVNEICKNLPETFYC